MNENSAKLKEYAKENGVYLWQVGEALGLQDVNFSKRMRHVSDDDLVHYKAIIDDIKKGGRSND